LFTEKKNKWMPVFLAAGLMFFIGFEMGGFQLVLSDISKEFNTTKTGMGFLAAAQYISVIVMPFFFGGVADRKGKNPVLTGFTIVFVSGCAMAALSGSVWAFITGAFLIGAGLSVCECVTSALITDLYPEDNVRYINICQCMLSAGAVISPIIVGWGIKNLAADWRSLFFICGAAYLVLLLFLVKAKFSVTAVRNETTGMFKIGEFMKSPVFVILFIAIILYVGLENGIGYFTETLFDLKLSQAGFGAYAISAYWTGMAISRLVSGARKQSPHRALIVCFVLSGALFTVLAFSGEAFLSLAACALTGAAFGPIWSTLIGLAAKQFPQNTGGAVGLMSSGCGLGGALYPVLMGLMADCFDIGVAFLLLAATALAGGGLCIVLAVSRSREIKRSRAG